MATSTHAATRRRNTICGREGRRIPARSSPINSMRTATAEAAVTAQIAQTDSAPSQYDNTGTTETEITTAMSNLVLIIRRRNDKTLVYQPSAYPGANANSENRTDARATARRSISVKFWARGM